jgi:AbrB family looped-hinge helix DNA binding protein
MPKVKVSAKGWIVIPADIRKRYGIEPGDEVHIVDYGGSLGIVPKLADPVEEVCGILADGGPSLTQELLHERRRALEREEAEMAWWNEKDGR